MKNSLMVTVVVGVVAVVLGFLGGMKYQQGQRPNAGFNSDQFVQGNMGRSGARQTVRNGNRSGNGNGFRPVLGQIISSDAGSITVKLQNGGSMIVLLSGSTKIDKTSPASKSDLVIGQTVSAFGTVNSDGSITAQNVQLNPEFRGGRTGGHGMMPQGTSGPQQ